MTTTISNYKEVKLHIEFCDGEVIKKAFDTCDEAWAYERKVKNYNLKRRAKADRRNIFASYSYGCTSTGKTYGNILTTDNYSWHELTIKFKLDDLKAEARWEARRARLEAGLTHWEQDFTDSVEGTSREL